MKKSILICCSLFVVGALILSLSGCMSVKKYSHRIDNYFSADPKHACDCFPPFITQVSVTNITATSADISFTCDYTMANPSPLNKYGTGQVKYDTVYSNLTGSGGTLAPNVSYTTLNLYQTPTISLSGLTANTTYYYYPVSHAKLPDGTWFFGSGSSSGEGTIDKWRGRMNVGGEAGYGTKTIRSFRTLPSGSLYTISGYVKVGTNGLTGVTVTLSGAGTGTYDTTSSGFYSFTNLASGTYTVTPSKTGYTFNPTNKTFNSITSNQTQDFAATPPATYTISGYIKTGSSVAISGVTVNLTGTASASATSDSSGYYSFSGLVAGNYTVTPTKSGYTVSPATKTYTSLSADQANQNFTGTVITYTISGYVRDGSSTAISGVTVNLTGASTQSGSTNASGYYSFTGLATGNYTVTPAKSGYTFNPANKSYSSLSSNQANQNFTGTVVVTSYKISGYVKNGQNQGISGVTMSLTGSAQGSVLTDTNGYYEFPTLASGSYTVTPARTNYTFVPANKTYSPLSIDQANQNFTGTAVVLTYLISGYVKDNTNTGISDVTMTLSGSDSDVCSTDNSGYYIFNNLNSGDYSVTPSKGIYIFSPTELTYNSLNSDQPNGNFIGSDSGIIIAETDASETTGTTAMISWTTNIPATSWVEYGEDQTYGHTTQEVTDTVTEHFVRLYTLTPDTVYHYRVFSRTTGNPAYSGDYTFLTVEQTDKLINPDKTMPYPNPCKTRASFNLVTNDSVDSVKIIIYTLSGRIVRTIEKQSLGSGTNKIDWDMKDDSGNKVDNGLYVYQIKVKKGFTEDKIKKANLMVIK